MELLDNKVMEFKRRNVCDLTTFKEKGLRSWNWDMILMSLMTCGIKWRVILKRLSMGCFVCVCVCVLSFNLVFLFIYYYFLIFIMCGWPLRPPLLH